MLAMLPPEILLQVFQHLCDSHRNILKLRGQSPSLILTHVCQSWRALTRTTPSLWTNFEVECPCSHLNSPKILSQFISNSSDALLTFCLVHPNDIVSAQCLENFVAQQLVHNAQRWKEACFKLPWTILSPLFYQITKEHDLSALQSLRIENTRERAEWVLTTSAQFPSLKHLAIDGIRLGHLRSQVSFSRLESLQADPIEVQDVLEAINESPHLCHVEVAPDTPFAWGRVVLRKAVTSFSITSFSIHQAGTVVEDLFARLTLPSLTFLQLVAIAGTTFPMISTDVLVAFLTRSACRLTHLTLKYTQFEDLLAIFSHTETITHLSLHESRTPYTPILRNNILDSIGTLNENQSSLLPKLRRLELVLVPACSQMVFLRVIRSRWRIEELQGSERLERLSLKVLLGGWLTDELIDGLGVMRNEGLDITVV